MNLWLRKRCDMKMGDIEWTAQEVNVIERSVVRASNLTGLLPLAWEATLWSLTRCAHSNQTGQITGYDSLKRKGAVNNMSSELLDVLRSELKGFQDGERNRLYNQLEIGKKQNKRVRRHRKSYMLTFVSDIVAVGEWWAGCAHSIQWLAPQRTRLDHSCIWKVAQADRICA
jgi:hypothetical protein